MILGTWNLGGVASPTSVKGFAQIADIASRSADVWFLTEVQETLLIPGMKILQSPGEMIRASTRRWSAIATHWHIEPVPALDHPISCLFCMTHLKDPMSGARILAITSVIPWRGAANHWRAHLDVQLGHADLCDAVYQHMFDCIQGELRSGERPIWGGDFNQGLTGRDHVGTRQNRATLIGMMETLKLRAPTTSLGALIETHPSIDHIALPASWTLTSEPRRFCPELNGRYLSDHALYVVGADAT